MQINFLNDFIKAYERAYNTNFDDSFKGRVQGLCRQLNEPFMHASYALEKELEELVFSLDKNINIAIIGQFSSGKSSLLNLILGRDCLPTGVVPVTFKPTFLHYAKEYFLRVEFEDGSDIITDIEELSFYTDQRKQIKQAKSLHIFAPISLLEKITLVDTPGLNANENDTLTTFNELKNIHGAIWLSLIDNAGKKSEEDTIKANLELLGENSICVLNQKDKLSHQELENVLNYTKEVFLKYFKELIAISCKEAKNEASYEKSNFEALLRFLQNLDIVALKEKFTQRKMLSLCEILENENKLFAGIFDSLCEQFQIYENHLLLSYEAFLKEIEILNHKILDQLKSISERIANEIFASVKEKDAHFYKKSKGFFTKDKYVRYDYKTPYISIDDAFLAMFYNSDVMNKEFKRIENELYKSFEEIKTQLKNFIAEFERKISLFKAEFSNIQKDHVFQSDKNFSELRAFCNASDEYFLKDFKELLFKSVLDLDLFFEKLNLKAFANYKNATKLSLAFFSYKINESRVLYELDSSEFVLFYPKKSEIYERVLNELHVYEFEALLIDKPVLTKIAKNFLDQNQNLIREKNKILDFKKAELYRRKEQIINVKNSLKQGL
ncbi:dynamin family protein [Campylobacter sp. VicNov18]|uniref:dynamin family protein n=1 Tax=Campylobacter bilis TaxID=2691918 RepID=UPI00130E662D|nr:dynamin family protein [Campylobacter bilis]MPV63355.1 ATP-binding protein [Campylobacter hepaticus]MBM0636854.1 ATP-binding protein [Campylobacter bilis]MCC8277425.1 dynamin family protein [Campylobacter bilis]MCC8299168.1 dynamin family protein [Campylobacter bilis]MCC8300334.1 dynamin family protein [Campylobacter bilis]